MSEEVFADLVVIGSQRVGIWEGGIAVHRVDKPGLEAWALHGNGLRIAQAEHVQREYQLRQVKEAGHFGGLIADTSYDHAAKTKGLRRDKGPLGHQRGVRDGDGEELRIVQYVLIGRVEELVVPVQIAAEQGAPAGR